MISAVLDIIKEILDHHGDTRAVVLSALSALGRKATTERNVIAMHQAGLIPQIVGFLKRFLEERDEEGTQLALMVLESIAVVSPLRAHLRKLSVLSLAMEAKNEFKNNAEIQEAATAIAGFTMHPHPHLHPHPYPRHYISTTIIAITITIARI